MLKRRRLHSRKIHRLAYIVVIIGMMISLFGSYSADKMTTRLMEERARAETQLIVTIIEQRLQAVEASLEGLAAFFGASSRVTEDEFDRFVAHLLSKNGPNGLTALMYVPDIRRDALPDYLEEVALNSQLYGRPPFKIMPEGERERYAPVTYVRLSNGEISGGYGFDLRSEAKRSAALDAAEQTGQVNISSTFEFYGMGNPGDSLGFIMVKAVDFNSDSKQRVGYTVAAFSAHQFASVLNMGDFLLGEFALYDAENRSNHLFMTENFSADDNSYLHINAKVNFGGKIWEVVMQPAAKAAYLSVPENYLAIYVLLGGLLVSLSIGATLMLLLNRKYNAELLARQMTRRYRHASLQAQRATHQAENTNELMEVSLNQLKALNFSLNRYAAITAHDLKSPLKRITSLVDFLVEDYADILGEDGQDMLLRIKRSTNKLSGTVSSLLTYSSSKFDEADATEFTMEDLLQRTLEAMALPELNDAILLEQNDPKMLFGNRELLSHVLQNLINNSLKFKSDKDLAIKISTQPSSNGGTEIAVEDNGIGIPPEQTKKVFDMFTRLHNDSEYEGHGIGLATCQRIVFDHGGTIFVDKNFEGGTRVVIRLPHREQRKVERGLSA